MSPTQDRDDFYQSKIQAELWSGFPLTLLRFCFVFLFCFGDLELGNLSKEALSKGWRDGSVLNKKP